MNREKTHFHFNEKEEYAALFFHFTHQMWVSILFEATHITSVTLLENLGP